jgi:hypothetical protein
METKPYVGITGTTTKPESEQLVELFEQAGFTLESSHIPMVGLLVSHKTRGGASHPKYPLQYPTATHFKEILRPLKDKVFTTIHYNTKQQLNLAEELEDVLDYDRLYELVDGIQLNKIWPSPIQDQIETLREKYPNLKFIFQIPKDPIKKLTPQKLAQEVAEKYHGLEYLIIDPSMGESKEISTYVSATIYNHLRDEGIDSIITFAGGLDGATVQDVLKSLHRQLNTYDFSIDAQGGLRTTKRLNDKDSSLSISRAKVYLQKAAEILL